MGFDIAPQSGGSQFRVFIDYALPEATPARWFGRMFGGFYARWCTRRMVNDAVAYFLTGENRRDVDIHPPWRPREVRQ
jgi:hypothetical protein